MLTNIWPSSAVDSLCDITNSCAAVSWCCTDFTADHLALCVCPFISSIKVQSKRTLAEHTQQNIHMTRKREGISKVKPKCVFDF
jgi:hypothetical protein